MFLDNVMFRHNILLMPMIYFNGLSIYRNKPL